jgi:hypothetical protein
MGETETFGDYYGVEHLLRLFGTSHHGRLYPVVVATI